MAALLAATAHGHIYRDHWMNKNEIDPDYMHHKAMQTLQRAAVLEAQIKEDDISAKRLVQEYDIGKELSILLPESQRFMYGFVNGSNTISKASVCQAAIINTIDTAFKLIDVRFIWLPQYTVKFNQA